jgi:hypothetical protein
VSALGKARAALEVAEKLADRNDDGWRLRAYSAGLDLGKQQQMTLDYAGVLAIVACAEALERIAGALEAKS